MVLKDIPLDALHPIGLAVQIDLGLQEGQILLATGRIGHKIEAVLATTGDNTVVHNTTSTLLQETGKSRLVRTQFIQRRRGDFHEKLHGPRTAQKMLNPKSSKSAQGTSPHPLLNRPKQNIHMADIKQTRLLPRPMVTFNMAEIRILQRHREPRKRHHAPSMSHMQIIELRLPRGLCLHRRRRIPHLGLIHGCLSSESGRRQWYGRGGAEGSPELSREQTRAISDDGSGLGG